MSARTDLTNMGGVSLVRPPDPPGQLQILLTVVDGQIVMDFGRALWWVGLTPAEAEKLAQELMDAVTSTRTLYAPEGLTHGPL